MFQFSPGCCCCYWQDLFDRADGSPGDAWAIDSGSWAVAGNKLRTSSTHGLIIWDSANSRDGGTQSASVTLAAGSNRVVRLILGYADADNYVAFQVTFGTGGHIAIIERVGGVETEYHGRYMDLAASTLLRATLTPAPDNSFVSFTATIRQFPGATPIEVDIHRTGLTYTGGSKAALSVESGSGNVDFDNWSFPYVVTAGTPVTCNDYTPLHCGGAQAGDGSNWTVGTGAGTTATAVNGHSVALTRWPHNRGEPKIFVTSVGDFNGAPGGVNAFVPLYWEVYLDWHDDENYHFAEVTFSAGTLNSGHYDYDIYFKLWRVEAGTPSLLDSQTTASSYAVSAAPTAQLAISWCFDGDQHTLLLERAITLVDIASISTTDSPIFEANDAEYRGWWGASAASSGISAKGVGNDGSPYDDGDCHNC